jgi:hypothetical protein
MSSLEFSYVCLASSFSDELTGQRQRLDAQGSGSPQQIERGSINLILPDDLCLFIKLCT